MIQSSSFLSSEVSLVYAMAWSRSLNTNRVVKKPEIEFIIRNRPVLVLDHKVIWRMLDLMDVKSKFSYENYMNMIEEEPEQLEDVINSHLESYPNVLFYGVTENDVLKEISMDKGEKIALKTKIITGEIAKKLAPEGFDFSLSWTKGGLTAHYIKDNIVIEMLIGRHTVSVAHRVKVRGVWLQPIEATQHTGHIGTMPATWFFNSVNLFLRQIDKFSGSIEIPPQYHIFWDKMADNPYYEDMSISDRNKLEHERWIQFHSMERI